MPVAVVELIAQELNSRLSELIDGEENTDVSQVVRPTRIGDYRPQDWQIVCVQGETGINAELSYPGNPPATCWETTFHIRCRIMPSEDETDSRDALMNQFAAVVRKAVCTPQNTWYAFDGNAIDAEWQAHELVQTDTGFSVNVPLLVRYRTDENNPYVVRG